MKLRPLALISLLLLLLLGPALQPAYAHANLLRSNPHANATLERPPVQVELYFSEALDAGFSTIEVFDGSGKRVDNDDAAVDLSNPKRLTTSLRSLPDGVYTVSWRVLSSVDGHVTTGAFPFAVGEVDALALAAAANSGARFTLAPGEVVARWLTYLSVMSLVGGMFFLLIVWRPACALTNLAGAVQPPWDRLANLALLLFIGAAVLWLFIQAGQVVGQEFVWPWDPVLAQLLFTTRFGALWLVRLALAVLLFWLKPGSAAGRTEWAALATGLLLLLTISLGSHAAAQPIPLLPVLADWLHLAAASVWVGGLICFVVGLVSSRDLDAENRTRLTAELIPRFSALALVTVGLLALTGLYASILHVPSLEGLFDTIYGRTLLLKVIIILPMLLLGAINLLVTSPRMKQAAAATVDEGQTNRFRRLVTSEMLLGTAVLLTVAVLTTLPPARVVSAISRLSETQDVDDLQISLEVTPGRPGLNAFAVQVDAGRRTLSEIKEVSLQFTPASGDLPPQTIALTELGGGNYTVEGGFLALPDVWQIQVAVRRQNAFDAFANFDFEIGVDAAVETAAGISAFPWNQLSAGLLLAAGVVGLLYALVHLLRREVRPAFLGFGPAVALAAIGVYILLARPGEQAAVLINPVAPNNESLAAGKELYLENCLPCHGLSGAGDGPVGRTLNPPPADLTLHTAPGVHPDGRLYDWISSGFPDSVMPAFLETLSDEERWHLVNYIRTLASP